MHVKHKDALDKAYAHWAADLPDLQYWESLSPNIREGVLVGNMNYQIENVSFKYWFETGYGTPENADIIINAMRRVNTSPCLKVAELIERALVIKWYFDFENTGPDVDADESSDFAILDSEYKRICRLAMADYESSMKTGPHPN